MTRFRNAAIAGLAGVVLAAHGEGLKAMGDTTLVTGTTPAIVHVDAAPSVGLTAGKTDAVFSLTLEPVSVDRSEVYLVNVYAIDPGSGAEAYAGSVSFFPPPVKGQPVDFVLQAEGEFWAQKNSVDLRIELIPATNDGTVQNSTVKVVSAAILR